MRISDATDFQVSIELRGMSGIGAVGYGFSRWIKMKIFRPRSSALICAIDKSQPQTKYRQWTFGQRQFHDDILYARKETFSTTNNEYPRHKIEFEDYNAIITAVTICFNVSICDTM